MHVIIRLWLDRAKFPQNSSQIYDNRQAEGRALAEPSGPCRLTFVPGQLENLSFSYKSSAMLSALDFTVSEQWAPFNVS